MNRLHASGRTQGDHRGLRSHRAAGPCRLDGPASHLTADGRQRRRADASAGSRHRGDVTAPVDCSGLRRACGRAGPEAPARRRAREGQRRSAPDRGRASATARPVCRRVRPPVAHPGLPLTTPDAPRVGADRVSTDDRTAGRRTGAARTARPARRVLGQRRRRRTIPRSHRAGMEAAGRCRFVHLRPDPARHRATGLDQRGRRRSHHGPGHHRARGRRPGHAAYQRLGRSTTRRDSASP